MQLCHSPKLLLSHIRLVESRNGLPCLLTATIMDMGLQACMTVGHRSEKSDKMTGLGYYLMVFYLPTLLGCPISLCCALLRAVEGLEHWRSTSV